MGNVLCKMTQKTIKNAELRIKNEGRHTVPWIIG